MGMAASEIPPDVLPLPLPITIAEEARLLSLLDISTPFSDVSLGFQKTIRTAGINAWLFLLIVALNFLHLGYGEVREWSAPSAGCPTEGQSGAWAYLLEQATVFVEQPGVVPGRSLEWGFGVPKLEEGQVNFNPLDVILRLIMTLQPSNALQLGWQ